MKNTVFCSVLLGLLTFCNAFTALVHMQITQAALSQVSYAVDDVRLYFFQSAIDQVAEANAEASTETDPTTATNFWHFNDETFSAGSQRIISFIDPISKNSKNGNSSVYDAGNYARQLLGQCLNTLQDFYSHTNWVELGNTGINEDLGVSVIPDPTGGSPCPNLPYVLEATTLTSGYVNNQCSPPPAGKCAHGGNIVVQGQNPCPKGINKDDPSRPNFQPAYNIAVNATIIFMNRLFRYIDAHTDNTRDALRILIQDQRQPNDDSDDGCLPYCAIFISIPGFIILCAVVFLLMKNNIVSSPFSSIGQQPREIANSQPV